ncbi:MULTISPECIES: hypothetical protein [unclassified Ectothiorhodospira]|uniref:hypothetical protein n=1 Tax=unclassified Ectothiorhodospira TaxID=2684909 RepID=UPI001EE98748|nr:MULTISPECIES: hypothetical protein [unclassified Ectothiorhodospira]MCG5517303.1 hypothetical protein [Ectothiorhodospira sp. 9100]MCG5520194.1 hypothetical protein [Ectothiorhodospira sp. 9905]
MHAAEFLPQRHARLSTFHSPQARPYLDSRHMGLTESQQLELACGRRVHRLRQDWLHLIYNLRKHPWLRCTTSAPGVELDQPLNADQASTMENTLFLRGYRQSLALNLDHWRSGFVMNGETAGQSVPESMRFFNEFGERIFTLQAASPRGLDPTLIQPFMDPHQGREKTHVPTPPHWHADPKSHPLDRLDRESLRIWWQLPTDFPAECIPGLPELSRTQMLETLGREFALRTGVNALHLLAESLNEQTHLPLRVSVSNGAVTQRHASDHIEANVRTNVLEMEQGPARARLELQSVETVWVVRKPGYRGFTLAIECHDRHGRLLMSIDDQATSAHPWNDWPSLLRTMQPAITAW